ncbi:MAG TPA: hypothetical protein VFX22_06100 [Candidatus Kapabacteria bacterium]|nr:hypothetical protein [Candidatus Kapabacteria bacterium]
MIDLNEFSEFNIRHCIDCDVLTEALRDLEQQCREVEDSRNAETTSLSQKTFDEMLLREEQFVNRLKKLEYRRNCALEILIKHQRLEHS